MYNKALLSLVALLSFKVFAMEFTLDKSLVKPQKGIGEVSVIHSNDGFYTEYKGNKSKAAISSNSPLLNMSSKQVKALIKTGSYLTVEDMGNGQHKIELKSKLKGGGPILAWWGYGVTKTVLYGLGITGLGAGIAATGGVVGAVGGVALAGATSGASVGVGVVAGAISGAGAMGAGVTAATVTGTGATLAATGGSFALITAGIETASMAVGGLLAMVPFL